MSNSTAGSIVVDLLLNSGGFESNVKKAEADIKRLAKKFEDFTGTAIKVVETIDATGNSVKKLAVGYDSLTGSIKTVEANYTSLQRAMENVNATTKIMAQTEANLAKIRGTLSSTEEARLRAQQANIDRSTRLYQEQAQARIAASNKVVVSTDKTSAATERMAGSVQKSQSAFRNSNQITQQASYQLTDFVMQVSGGTSAMRAFSQQAPQMLAAFGGAGAALGLVAAIGGAIADLVMKAGGEKTTADLFKNLTDGAQALDSAMQSVVDVDLSSLGKNYREATEEGKKLINANLSLQLTLLEIKQIDATKTFRDGITESLKEIGTFMRGVYAAKVAVENMFGIGNRTTKLFGFSEYGTKEEFANIKNTTVEVATAIDEAKKKFGETQDAATYVSTLNNIIKANKNLSDSVTSYVEVEQQRANSVVATQAKINAITKGMAGGYQGLEKAPSSRATKVDNKEEKMFNNMRVGADKFEQAMLRSNQQVANQESLLGKTAQEMEVLNAKYKIQAEQEKVIQDIIIQNGFIRQAERDQINAAAEAAIATQTAMITSRQEQERSAQYGIIRGFQNYADTAGNVAKGIESAFGNAMTNMETGLTRFVLTGKASFTDFANALINDIMRIYIRMALTGLVSKVATSFSMPDASGQHSVQGNSDYVYDLWKGGFAGYAGGGFTGEGNKYDIAGPVHKGEFVFNKEATKRIGVGNLYKMMRGYADGGYVGGAMPTGTKSGTGDVSIVVNNNSSNAQATATSTTDSFGNRQIEILVADMVNKAISTGKTDSAMRSAYNIRRSGK